MKKRNKSMPSARRPSMAEQVSSLSTDLSNRAFARAQELSALAKVARGRERQRLYMGKHSILSSLVQRGVVRVTLDDSRQVGLLSIVAPSGQRLHTSDAWLEAAVSSTQPGKCEAGHF